MKRLLVLLLSALPFASMAADYQSTLLVQTGLMRESDLIIRTVSDLESNKICLAFYVSTVGTSPAMTCYDVTSGFRSNIMQVGHFSEDKLIVRKIKDTYNAVSCLVAYVSTSGTSPAIDCYQSRNVAEDDMVRDGHLREGDLDIYRIVDPDSTKTCLIAYVKTASTSPTLKCYNSVKDSKGAMSQTSYMREGDLVVRKIVDENNRKECLITYVSTEGTSPYIFCSDADKVVQYPAPPRPPAPAPAPPKP